MILINFGRFRRDDVTEKSMFDRRDTNAFPSVIQQFATSYGEAPLTD